jgi:transposase
VTGDDDDVHGRQREADRPGWGSTQPAPLVGEQEDGRGAAPAAGEPLDKHSRELEVEAHRLAAWRDDFLEHGRQGLKASRAERGDAAERRLEQAERKVGELTLENEILRAAAEKRGFEIPPKKRPR